MSITYIVAQIINCIGSTINMVGISVKEKRKILLLFTIGNTCVAIALGLLGAKSGMTVQAIFVIESIINYFLDKKYAKYPKWLIFLYTFIPTIVLIINFESFWDLLPLIGGIVFPLALLSKDLFLRNLNLVSVILWIPYGLHFEAYVSAISCTIFSIINISAIIRFDVLKWIKKSKNIIETSKVEE